MSSSLVQSINNRKRPRTFEEEIISSNITSPRNSSTPIFKSSATSLSSSIIDTNNMMMSSSSILAANNESNTNSNTSTNNTNDNNNNNNNNTNPFLKHGLNSNNPICLDSDDDLVSEIFGNNNHQFNTSFERGELSNKNNEYFMKHKQIYDSDESVIIVDDEDEDDTTSNPFSNDNAILYDDINGFDSSSSNENDSNSKFKRISFNSDTSFNFNKIYPEFNASTSTRPLKRNNSFLMLKNSHEFKKIDSSKKRKTDSINDEDSTDNDGVSNKILPPQLELVKTEYLRIHINQPRAVDVKVPLILPTNSNKLIDEDNGHYKVQIGSTFANYRFRITKSLGQGTYGKVVEAIDTKKKNKVAIKIIKAIPKYREAAKVELRVLKTLQSFDPTNDNGCIHFKEVFDYQNHISIVTELYPISVYDFFENNHFKKFPGSHIQSFAKQLLKSVTYLHDLNIIHTDLKPENILLENDDNFEKYYFDIHKSISSSNNKSKNFKKLKHDNALNSPNRRILKDTKMQLIDFGSAVFNDEFHPELVSTRHYRAPEVSFGIGWSYECDVWSVACVLMEFLLGQALFNTHDNREHLLMMERIINQKLDFELIKSCGIESYSGLNKLRQLRRPYSNYGNHYSQSLKKRSFSVGDNSRRASSKEINGFGSIPSKSNVDKIKPDVSSFLKERGDNHITKKNNSNSSDFVDNFKSFKFMNYDLIYQETGIKKIKQKYPKDADSKLKKNVGELAPIEELISTKIGIYLDLSMNLEESYFKYCLSFSNESTDKKLLMDLKGINFLTGTILKDNFQDNYDGNKFKNLNSIAGGCINTDWIKTMEIYGSDYFYFYKNLKDKLTSGNSNNHHNFDNLIIESISKRHAVKKSSRFKSSILNPTNLRKVYQTYPANLTGTFEQHVNDNGINVIDPIIVGPVDFDTFKFWWNFADLLKKLFVWNPYERLTASEALNHEWFNCGIYDDGTLKFKE